MKRLQIKLVLLFVVFLNLVTALAQHEPTLTPQATEEPYEIVYTSEMNAPAPVSIVNPDGTNERFLWINGENDYVYDPICSPDGKYLAYYRIATETFFDEGYYLINAQTMMNEIAIPLDEGSIFSLSMNAEKVAFREGHDIFVMNIDGSGLMQLTTHPEVDTHPAISPDGTKVVFESNRSGIPNDYQLYIIDVDGSNLVQLTNVGNSNAYPSWSPNGEKIAFRSDRPNNTATNIYVMDANGNSQTALTNLDTTANWAPSWSPDGTKIAFVSDRDDEDKTDRFDNMDIYIMDVDGSNVTRVTNSGNYDYQPCWLLTSTIEP